jgi:hypothetical protein
VRTRTILAAGLLTAVFAACSRPEPAAQPADTDTSAPIDLALYPPSTEPPIASELEAPRPPAPEVAPRPVPVARRNARPEPLGNAVAANRQSTAAESLTDTGAPADPRVDETEQVAVAGPAAEPAAGGGKPRPGMTDGAGRVPDPGPGRSGPVIIRGGVGGVDDDCVVHRSPPDVGDIRPPAGGTTVLINDRTPRRGPPQVADRSPPVADRTPARGIGSRGAAPRGGGIGRIGIR